jgi:hypothetical protein
MRVTELPHVLGASEGYDPRGNILRIVTDLPLRSGAPGHNAKKLMGLRKAIERIRTTDPYLKYDYFELTNEGATRMGGGAKSGQHAGHWAAAISRFDSSRAAASQTAGAAPSSLCRVDICE